MKRNLFPEFLIISVFLFFSFGYSAVQAEYDVDTDFRPIVDGFQFENYGNSVCVDSSCQQLFEVQNLTSWTMRRLFGDQVCHEILQDDGCILYKVAETWMDSVNQSMNKGHCEGMAVLSTLFYANILDPQTYGAETVNQLTLSGNTALQEEIAYWFATQWYMDDYVIEKDPVSQLKVLITDFKDHPNLLIPVAIYQNITDFGHTLLAYAISDKGNGIYWLLVYDSNFPNEERHIEIDVSDNSWSYQSLSFPERTEVFYYGIGMDNPFQLAPINSRLRQYDCDFCPESEENDRPWEVDLSDQSEPHNRITVNSGINLYFENEAGQKAGFDWENGANYNEIAGLNIRRTMGQTSALLPIDEPYYLWLNEPSDTEWQSFDVSISSPGAILYLDNLHESYEFPNLIYRPEDHSAADQQYVETFEVVTLPGNLPEIRFVTSHDEEEYRFEISLTAISSSQMDSNINVLLFHDSEAGEFGINLLAAKEQESSTFDNIAFILNGKIVLYNDEGESTIEFGLDSSIQMEINGSIILDYGIWKNSDEFTITGDLDGDGVFETRKSLE